MSITNTTVKQRYNCDGSVTSFAIPFVFAETDEIQVYLRDEAVSPVTETLLTEGVAFEYTLTGGTPAQPVFVTTNVAYAATYKIVIIRNTELTQELDLAENDPFPADDLEASLDKHTRQNQELNETMRRSILLPISTELSDLVYPDPVAYGAFRWNSTADDVESPPVVATAPLVYTPATATHSIPAANSTTNGYLTAADWTLFNSKMPGGAGFTNVELAGYLASNRRDESSAATINALIATTSYVKLTSTVTTINGIAAGVNGQIIVVYNNTGSNVSITNNNGSAVAANRIITSDGASISLADKTPQAFIYDTGQSKWVVWGGGGSGGGGASFFPIQETPATGIVDGVNSVFTTSSAPYNQASIIVFVDGISRPVTTAWTLSGSTVTFTAGNIPAIGQKVEFWYLNQVGVGPSGFSGYITQGTGAAPVSIAPAVGVTSTTDFLHQKYITGVAAGGAQLVTAVPQISAGATVGQKLILKMRGNGVDYPIFQAGVGGLVLNGNWPGAPLSITEQSLGLDWDGTNWTEDFRT